jgi:roadblock/LC7 domain-containing protein
MSDLNKLMSLDGALASFNFNDHGEILQFQVTEGTRLDETSLDLLAHMCVANLSIATMQARGWESVSGQKGFYPINGFSLIGLEWTAFAVGNVGIVVSNDKTDYQAAFALLEQEEAA